MLFLCCGGVCVGVAACADSCVRLCVSVSVCVCVCVSSVRCTARAHCSLQDNNLGEEAGKAIGAAMQHTPNLQCLK